MDYRARALPPGARKTLKTLIVEDDRVSAVLLRRLLEQLGHEVILAENGVDAWRRLRTECFGLVITDWAMPAMTGLDLAKRIREWGDDAPYLILLSSKDRTENRDAAIAAGVDDFLTRPFDRDELLARLSVAERQLRLQADLQDLSDQLARTSGELVRITQIDEKNIEEIRATCRDLEFAQVQLQALSITDSLTGLKNHREFQERLEDEIHRASRYHLPLSLIMLDVDHFKRFNDTYGHPAGDQVLKRIAHILESHARDTDILARYGGEEFAVILSNTDRAHAMAAADRFRTAIGEEPWTHQPITVSMGVSTLRPLPQSRTDLTSEADMALYTSKRLGRDCAAHYSDIREAA